MPDNSANQSLPKTNQIHLSVFAAISRDYNLLLPPTLTHNWCLPAGENEAVNAASDDCCEAFILVNLASERYWQTE